MDFGSIFKIFGEYIHTHILVLTTTVMYRFHPKKIVQIQLCGRFRNNKLLKGIV